MRKINPLFVLMLVMSAVAPTALSAQDFDKPIRKQVVDFGPSPYYGPPYYKPKDVPRIELSCYYYHSVVVKEFDDKQKGAAWLAIVPIVAGDPVKCEKQHGANEKVVSGDGWSGYFMGVKGNFVFFIGDDGVNGAMPFVIYDAKTQKKVFEDTSYDSGMFNHRVKASPFNHLQVFSTADGQLRLVYLRGAEADCDLPLKGAACWASIRKKFGLRDRPMPTCTGYKEIDPQYRPYVSAIVYPVEVTLFPKPVTKTIEGPVKCWPVD